MREKEPVHIIRKKAFRKAVRGVKEAQIRKMAAAVGVYDRHKALGV
ncbi:MAG: hypothetical protein ACOYJC_00665 [Christensenellales bacterium]